MLELNWLVPHLLTIINHCLLIHLSQDYPMEICSNGSFDGIQYFYCPSGKGLFCLLTALEPDQRYHDVDQVPVVTERQDYNNR